MHKKSTKTANFSDVQRSPIIVELEKQLLALQGKKKLHNKKIQQLKTNSEKLKKEIMAMQTQFSLKVSHIMNKMEILRKEIISLCKKLTKSKKISKSERREVRELEKEFAGRSFFPDDMEEFLRQRNKDNQDERGFNFFEKYNVTPKEPEKRDIRRIYLRLADQFHPDRSRTKEQERHLHELMTTINEAYSNYDMETLLRIQAEYCNSDVSNCSDIGSNRNEPDYKVKLEAAIDRAKKEIEFLKSQSKRLTQELKKINKSEPGQMMAKKLQAEAVGKDGLTALISDVEAGHKQLSAVKEMLEKCVKEGILPDDLMFSVLGGVFGDVVVDDLIQGLKKEFGKEFSDVGVPDSVMQKIVTKILQTHLMGKKPNVNDFCEIFMESMMEEGLTEIFMESMMEEEGGEMFGGSLDEYLFTETFTPQRKTPKKRRQTKNKSKRKQTKTAQMQLNF